MLNRLRSEALALIVTAPHCTLSTTGPAGVQASIVACQVRGERIYALVPSTADHLFNLEHDREVLLTAALWQLRGAARAAEGADGLDSPEGHTLLEVVPLRMHLEAAGSRRYRETIDFDAT